MMTNDSSFPGSRNFAELSTRSLDDFDRAACSIGRLEQIGRVADDDLRKGAATFRTGPGRHGHFARSRPDHPHDSIPCPACSNRAYCERTSC
jgi:hypothetical protein